MIYTRFTSAMKISSDERGEALESDIYAYSFIPKRVQRHECDQRLYETKWFDYRMMTPLMATRLYLVEHAKIYRRVYKQEMDARRAEFITPPSVAGIEQGLTLGKMNARRQLTAAWRGRQFADAIGMPYGLYVQHMMTSRMRAWKRDHLPRLEHLYHEIDLEKTHEAWERIRKSELHLAEHAVYMTENYHDLPQQRAYHEWIFDCLSARPNRTELLAGVVGSGHMPVAKALSRIDEQFHDTFYHYLAQS